ncbi:multidrug resistance protein [mine drainage metagenome]|uniref:Multidrug resistance protein n=1 Tax=mine drainage metagenome TaxID=410659 RepID=T1CFX1_9ZZZZ
MKLTTARLAAPLVVIVLLAACSKAPAPTPPPPQVDVITAKAVDLPIVRTMVGRLAPTLTAQVNARVTGNVLSKDYREGGEVKAGQSLFQIDPAPLKAALDAQLAALAQARASATNAQLIAARDKTLVGRGLIARQTYDTDAATARTTAAAVQQAEANVEAARLNLSYAHVTAPISGRAGIANVTVGALVSATSATPMTTIERLDPIYALFSAPYAQVAPLQQAEASGAFKALGAAPSVRLILPDGSTYPETGKLDFTDMAVDPQTGAVQLRAIFPNPQRLLLPGLFVTVKLSAGVMKNVFLIPQAAVQRDPQGAYVFVLGAGNKVEQRPISLGAMHGSDWVVTHGLANGERIIVNGVQKVHPGGIAVAAPQQAGAAPGTAR